jgi:hypothetical protein
MLAGGSAHSCTAVDHESRTCRSMKREKSSRPKPNDLRIFFSSAELHPSPKNVRPSFLPAAWQMIFHP